MRPQLHRIRSTWTLTVAARAVATVSRFFTSRRFSLAVLTLQAEASIMAESGAMVSMSANVELQSQMKGGLLGALKRAAGGESALSRPSPRAAWTGRSHSGAGRPGDIAAIEMRNQSFFVQSSSYLAGDASLDG